MATTIAEAKDAFYFVLCTASHSTTNQLCSSNIAAKNVILHCRKDKPSREFIAKVDNSRLRQLLLSTACCSSVLWKIQEIFVKQIHASSGW